MHYEKKRAPNNLAPIVPVQCCRPKSKSETMKSYQRKSGLSAFNIAGGVTKSNFSFFSGGVFFGDGRGCGGSAMAAGRIAVFNLGYDLCNVRHETCLGPLGQTA
jgi:hypothetical protein